MAFVEKDNIKYTYKLSTDESETWREDYKAYERLMNNDLMEGLDPNLPEVNDGTLAASLFKLPKRIISSDLTGTVKAIDRDEAWLGELASIIWQKEIIPYANTQAPFWRKWKDAVRKAAGYGSVPLITLFVDTDGRRHADFIVALPKDVTLEAGKVSDYDSDIMFWDVYYSDTQLKGMIEQAEKENKGSKETDSGSDSYSEWNIDALKKVLESKQKEQRSSLNTPRSQDDKVRPEGYHFCIAVQRGVDAPFYMYHPGTGETVRDWTNPDPTGDTPIHFLYCYQDFVNPYGIGIVKLAGGTQNVLDYMRQADVLATQIGLRPPIAIEGTEADVDVESMVYAQDALWFTNGTKVQRQELSNGIYQQLPDRMGMYKTSLNQLIPTGDTSISAASGDPSYSKTPAGVKFQQGQLSIDDEDFKDNLYMTFAAVAKSMINTHIANKEGTDIIKLSDDEREVLIKAGFDNFPVNEAGEPTNQIEITWDDIRGKFDFIVDPEASKATDDATRLEGLMKVAELTTSDPTLQQKLMMSGKKLNEGELYSEIIKLTTNNDKIITDVSPEDEQEGIDPETGQPLPGMLPGQEGAGDDMMAQQAAQQSDERHQMEMQAKQQDMDMKREKHEQSLMSKQPMGGNMPAQPEQLASEDMEPVATMSEGPTPEEAQINIEAVMEEFGVDEETAALMLAAEHEGTPPEEIIKMVRGGL